MKPSTPFPTPSTTAGVRDIAGQFPGRWERAWGAMEDAGYSALVVAGRGFISQYGYVEYLTGYMPLVRIAYAVLTPGRGPVLVVTTRADAWLARQVGVTSDIRVAGEGDVLAEHDQAATVTAGVVAELGAARGRVGVVGLHHVVSVGEYELLRGQLPEASLEDATELLAEIKAIKDEEDVRQVEATVAVADAGIRRFAEIARPGMTGWELFGEMERVVRARGARETLLFVSAEPYFLCRPTAAPLNAGDLVTVYAEITGATGYWVERAALFALGPIDDRRRRLADACLASLAAATEQMRPGAPVSAVAAVMDEHARAAEAISGIWHGHGVGIDHDLPIVTAGETRNFAEGMVVALHPNLSDADEQIGASVADTFAIESGGARRLSELPQHLFELEGR